MGFSFVWNGQSSGFSTNSGVRNRTNAGVKNVHVVDLWSFLYLMGEEMERLRILSAGKIADNLNDIGL